MALLAVVLVLLVVAAAGCGAGPPAPEAETPEIPERSQEAVREPPAWLGGEFDDGTAVFRYPDSWKRGSTERFGELVSDNRSAHPAFVSVRYLDEPLPATLGGFAELAGRTLRPPAGRGLALVYRQPAVLGGIRGFEATFVWAMHTDRPLGPTMRTFGVTLRSGRTAFLVFAAERPRLHAATFGWIKKTIEWTDAPRRAAGPVIERQTRRFRGYVVNEA